MLCLRLRPDRALRQIADYSCRLNVDESEPGKEGGGIYQFSAGACLRRQLDEADRRGRILDMAMSGHHGHPAGQALGKCAAG